MAEYFTLKPGTDRSYAEVQSPVNAYGHPYAYKQTVSSDDKGRTRTVDSRVRLPDCIKCITTLIVSKAAAELISDFVLPPNTSLLPVDVYGVDGSVLDEVIAILFDQHHDIVDLEASPHEKMSDGNFWYFTGPPVVYQSGIIEADLMSVIYLRCLATKRLKDAIVKAKLTNFTFQPVVMQPTS